MNTLLSRQRQRQRPSWRLFLSLVSLWSTFIVILTNIFWTEKEHEEEHEQYLNAFDSHGGLGSDSSRILDHPHTCQGRCRTYKDRPDTGAFLIFKDQQQQAREQSRHGHLKVLPSEVLTMTSTTKWTQYNFRNDSSAIGIRRTGQDPAFQVVQQTLKSLPITKEQQVDSSTSLNTTAVARTCHGYNGILLITHILPKAGVGTVFFQSILSTLLYAEHYHLRPWIHINSNRNKVVYDSKVHGIDSSNTSTLSLTRTTTRTHFVGSVSNIKGRGDMICTSIKNQRPGPPDFASNNGCGRDDGSKRKEFAFKGNGMWSSYFEPVIVPEIITEKHHHGDSSHHYPCYHTSNDCWSSLPMFTFSFQQATTAMSMCSEHAVRAWPYRGTPKALQPYKDQTIYDWLGYHRQRAAVMIAKYYQPKPWLMQRVDFANPIKISSNRKCLSIHVRLTDKGSGREKKGVGEYLDYAIMFVNATNGQYPIYLATDDESVVSIVQQALHPAVVMTQSNVTRNTNHSSTTPTFELLQNDTHRSNTEALVDIYAMAKCMYFIHGFSGMSEAVVYISIATAMQEQSQSDSNSLWNATTTATTKTTTKTSSKMTKTTDSSRSSSISDAATVATKYIQDRTINIDNRDRKSRRRARRLFQRKVVHDQGVRH